MAREMYPEKFGKMISPDHFDKANEEAQRAPIPTSFMGYPVKVVDRLTDNPNPLGRMATPEEANDMVREIVEAQSPISRLFAAVRNVISCDLADMDGHYIAELEAAYKSLNLTEDA